MQWQEGHEDGRLMRQHTHAHTVAALTPRTHAVQEHEDGLVL